MLETQGDGSGNVTIDLRYNLLESMNLIEVTP
jgi:hypothetical protein